MSKAVQNKIDKIYKTLFKKVFTVKNSAALSRGNKKQVKRAILRLKSSKQFDDFAKKFSKELARQGLHGTKGVWRKYFEAAKKSGYIALNTSYSTYEYNNMSAAIKNNFKMIKSIPDKFLNILEQRYTSTLIEEVAKGAISRGSFKKQLEKHGHKNAGVIARTETAKLQTAILEERATQLGSVAYIWLSSNDRRTRQSHKDMNGVVVFWRGDTEKPKIDNMQGNAGEFPNCRCSPQPIVDIRDLPKHAYKVYNYNTHKVINMKKRDLINVLEKGSL